jgi:hypothetical protein
MKGMSQNEQNYDIIWKKMRKEKLCNTAERAVVSQGSLCKGFQGFLTPY